MPLIDVSPNIQDAESPSRKRTLDEFAQMEHSELPASNEPAAKLPCLPAADNNKENEWLSTPKNLGPSPAESSPASLTPSGSSPLDRRSVSPNPTPKHNLDNDSPHPPHHHTAKPVIMAGTPTRASAQSTLDAFTQPIKRKRQDEDDAVPPKPVLQVPATSADSRATTTPSQPPNSLQAGQQPARKKRATKVEIEARKAEIEAKKAEKEQKDAEKAAKAAEKAAEKAKADAEKQAKAEERERRKREKEEEEARKAEEVAKKARAQPTLASFFKPKPTMSKESKTDDAALASSAGTPQKPEAKEVSVYEQMFKPFFVKEQVTLAPLFQMDEVTRDAKTRIFEEYLSGKRGEVEVKPFNPEQSLQLPFLVTRGRLYPSVREIMAEWNDNSARKPVDLTTESQNTQIRRTRQALQDVPMKFLGFKEDVRPPYYGTVTNMPNSLAALRKLARNPVTKGVLPLQYDYDSEAEWQEEDGEDVDLMDDEEDDADNDEDMGDFLDDSEDVSLSRPLLVSGLEPESTGICWENRKRLGPLPHMFKFRMEFILESLEHHSGIDPFSTQYWEPARPNPSTSTLQPAGATYTRQDSSNVMAPPTVADRLKSLSSTSTPNKKTAVLQADMIERLKKMVMEKRGLSRVGIIELFSSENKKATKAAIRNTLEMITEKSGKDWVLKAGV
ncbi:Chromatin assembly factor 1 subunit rlf2 [Coniochaeta hoffmannii]|uniref:Chromatin assembly factor 1 subunit rlf2 n=1 Tax=Coniochaeta hoffmannii TaxID=91930 RepID=A0AA38RNZ1_9PEZI|nr:Chromatin assembly factor 1 subunit rlf2 [Coniochaeta hoffmannii]